MIWGGGAHCLVSALLSTIYSIRWQSHQPSTIHLYTQCHHVFTFFSAYALTKTTSSKCQSTFPILERLSSAVWAASFLVWRSTVSYVLSLALQSAKKRPSVLHEIEAWGISSDSSPLFFVREHRLNIQMLVDTVAACSLLPLSCIDH